MLSRFISKSSQIHRLLTLIPSQTHLVFPKSITRSSLFSNPAHHFAPRNPHFSFFSTSGKNGNSGDDSATSTTDLWKMSSDLDGDIESVFSIDSGDLEGFRSPNDGVADAGDGGSGDNFGGVAENGSGGGSVDLGAEEDFQPWSFAAEEKEKSVEDLFGIEAKAGSIEEGLSGLEDGVGKEIDRVEKSEEEKQLESEAKALTAVLQGPDRAFGDLIASSGITDEMLDSLIALKDFEGIKGLPPLSEIEDMRYQKNTKKSSRAEIERQKQEEVAKARVRQVDAKGRAYGTGRRKCSIARVWIQAGEGKFLVNDKEFDVYFPMIDHRATLLRPFSETKTLGMWDVNCTVKGGGTSGQVGAIRLGISRALQNWEPEFRPPLKQAGFLTRDPRVVERKKPGKAKARKSFQWVKR
ncbi:Ribosomal protein S5 domain 2-like superfamily protein [Striga hermonthica]|uniref:Ribosomal protein S5 domain 2-like superfamily protein n=1 Tax=Striga hermonthica TaxID=68872 RepID=A0A9N7N7Y7_STRHE|nr:Ribosomal protein S5 domain 2-like superfamily protein [Striga hermonthica]